MNKKKNAELSQMFRFAGNRHWLTVAGCILSGLSTVLSMIPFVCIWFVVRDILQAMIQGDISLASESGHYAWLAVVFSLLSILLYFLAHQLPDLTSAVVMPVAVIILLFLSCLMKRQLHSM